MKNRRIKHSRQQTKIYESYYKPSFNLWLFLKSILGVVLFGRSTVAANGYTPLTKRLHK